MDILLFGTGKYHRIYKDCFRKEISGNDWTKKKERKWQKDLLQQCKEIKNRDFAMWHYANNIKTRIPYGDLWDF